MQLNHSVQDLIPSEVDCMNRAVAHRARAFFRSHQPRTAAPIMTSTNARVDYNDDQASESSTFLVDSSVLFSLE